MGKRGQYPFVRSTHRAVPANGACPPFPQTAMTETTQTSPRRIIIFDTTLRDGEQSPGASMNLAEKMEVAQALLALGVDVIEAGFPIASPGDFEAVREIAR